MHDRQGASGGSGRRDSYHEVVAGTSDAENERLRARIAELERLVEEIPRGSKHQAAPFSTGDPKTGRPGRGARRARAMASTVNRMAPAVEPDRILDAPAPEECPGCGGATEFERITEQFQTELPEPRPTTTCFNVEVRRCGSCGTRVQGRHPEQTSDALGAAAAQVGPRAMAWGTWLHYSLGLSFAKTSACSGAWVSGSPPGHLFIVGIDDHRSRPHPQRHQGPRRSSAAVVMDETGWRIGGEGVWLWVAATDDSTIYDVARAGALTRPSAWFRPTTPGPSSVTAGSSTTAT